MERAAGGWSAVAADPGALDRIIEDSRHPHYLVEVDAGRRYPCVAMNGAAGARSADDQAGADGGEPGGPPLEAVLPPGQPEVGTPGGAPPGRSRWASRSRPYSPRSSAPRCSTGSERPWIRLGP